MKDKIYVVYLRKNSKGSFTFIDGKRYFIDRSCTELQNKEGICFVTITKDKGNYGFVSGSFTCPVKSVSIDKYEGLDERSKIFTYGGCIFVEEDDCLSAGISSVYVWFEGELKPRRITSYYMKGCFYNKSLISYLHFKGVNITNKVMLNLGVVNISSVPFEEVVKLLVRISSNISSISILKNKILKLRHYLVEKLLIEHYIVLTEDGSYRNIDSSAVLSTKYSKDEIKDITSDVLNFAKEHYICKRSGFSSEPIVEYKSTFMGVNLSVLLMDSDNYSDEAWEENKDKIIKSAEEYSQRVSALRKYVTAKTAKDYKAILLDSLIWK